MRGPSPDRRAFRARKGLELRVEDQYKQNKPCRLQEQSIYVQRHIIQKWELLPSCGKTFHWSSAVNLKDFWAQEICQDGMGAS